MLAVHTLSVSLPPTRVAAFICFSTAPGTTPYQASL